MSTSDAAEQLRQAPHEDISLPEDEVHVWRAQLGQPPSKVTGFFRTLAPDEKAKAARFYFEKDREHFIVARGVLRAILSRYLKGTPDELRFGYSPYGKPFLVGDSGGDLRFNVSHSDGVGLFAVTRGRELGIDIERMRAEVIEQGIAELFFS